MGKREGRVAVRTHPPTHSPHPTHALQHLKAEVVGEQGLCALGKCVRTTGTANCEAQAEV